MAMLGICTAPYSFSSSFWCFVSSVSTDLLVKLLESLIREEETGSEKLSWLASDGDGMRILGSCPLKLSFFQDRLHCSCKLLNLVAQ